MGTTPHASSDTPDNCQGDHLRTYSCTTQEKLMTNSELATLRENTRLVDFPMTFFPKIFVQNAGKGIYCFSSAFFKLIYCNEGEYCYQEI